MDQQLKYIDKIGLYPSKAVTFKEGPKPSKVIQTKRSSVSHKQKQLPLPTSYRAVKFDVYKVGSTKTDSRLGNTTNQTFKKEAD